MNGRWGKIEGNKVGVGGGMSFHKRLGKWGNKVFKKIF